MKTVLLVEPNKKVAKIIKDFLEKDDRLKVLVAHSSQEALDEADEKKPDIVVLELAIPNQNGFAFLHEFRSYDDWSDIPVVVHSHLARDEAAASKSWKTLGAYEYLYKPATTLAKLRTAVNSVLNI